MIIKPDDRHKAFRDEWLAVALKHGEKMPAIEILAMASHLVGQLIAVQDQRKTTPEMALRIVQLNIEQGNKEVLDGLISSQGTA